MSDSMLVSTVTAQTAIQTDSDIDALPYVDREIDEGDMKATVDRLIEQEMRRMKKKDRSSLPMQVELFQNNESLSQEWQRVSKKEPLDALDTTRYELQGPTDDKADDVQAWQAAVDNTKAQLESQANSMFNLELLQKYGANAWRVHNYQMENYLKHIKKATEEYRSQIREINRQRKADQMQAAGSLRSLENKWSDLISQNLQVDIACSALENEVAELRRYKASLDK
ncbi:Pre-mRNA-splicing factor SPF27 [Radiomyces spectabilis]|uniref:Pre-mRNA-splicing factor SPF27 n=1 Tax=Radiomyces spectabilis TaxID=64574 RepID=UPI00221E6CA4|nr:Pre-mRNA-splicing factor SPF27 [Radiomyces spectabilis]KAI8377400.1 Pre-mRNA-splicing factor SPF27 [Radiomyces spectabilis]